RAYNRMLPICYDTPPPRLPGESEKRLPIAGCREYLTSSGGLLKFAPGSGGDLLERPGDARGVAGLDAAVEPGGHSLGTEPVDVREGAADEEDGAARED